MNEKGIEVRQKQAVSPSTGSLARNQIPFEEVIIELDGSGAWTLDGRIALAFGQGAEIIGNVAGVSITKPEFLKYGDEKKNNPFILYDEIGQPSVIFIRKIGIYIGKDGMIRYVDLTDRIDISSYIAERAVKVKKSDDCPKSAAVFCTRKIAEAWNEKAKEPGQDIWWFVPTQGREVGVAFNLSANINKINKLQEEIIHFRKTILRRFETATNRRIINSLVPEFMRTNQLEATYDKQYYHWDLKLAKFKLLKPTPTTQFQGFELGLYHQIARAIKEDNSELRNRAINAFSQMYGIPANISEINPDMSDPISVEYENEVKDVNGVISDDKKEIEPVPETTKMSELREYVKAQIPKLSDEAIKELDQITEGTMENFKGQEMAKAVKKFFQKIAGAQKSEVKPQEVKQQEVKSNDKRKLLAEKLAEGDKKLIGIFYGYFGEEWNFENLSDIEIDSVYEDYLKSE
jgi:hypothetical protein